MAPKKDSGIENIAPKKKNSSKAAARQDDQQEAVAAPAQPDDQQEAVAAIMQRLLFAGESNCRFCLRWLLPWLGIGIGS